MTAVTSDAGPSLAGKVGRGLGWGMTSNLVIRVGNFGVSILVARLVAPAEFGVYAVALTVWMILGTLAEFGLGADLVRAADPGRRTPTVATLGVLTGGLLAAAMALGADLIAAAFNSPDAAAVIRLMSVSLALFGLTIVPAALLQRAYRQRELFAVNLLALLGSTAVLVVLALGGAGAMSLAWSQITTQLMLVLGLHLVARHRPRFGFERSLALESVRFCVPLAVANLLSWLLLSVGNVIVSRELGALVLGLYVLAFNISSWPMSAVGQAIRAVALPGFAEVAEERNAALVRASAPIATLAVALGLGLSTLALPLLALVYGDRWTPAAPALAGLAAFGGLRIMLDLLATFLIAAGRTVEVLLVQVVWLVATVPAMFVAIAGFGLAGAGWAPMAVGVAVVLPAYAVCLRRVGVDVRAFFAGWTVPLVAVVPAAAACGWIGLGLGRSAPLLALLAGAATVALLYLAPLGRWWWARITLLRQPAATGASANHPEPEGIPT